MKQKLGEILPITLCERKPNDWELAELKLGFSFPNDYKQFIDSYGCGGINEFLWILSPFAQCNNLNTIEKFKEMKAAFCQMQAEFPELFTFNFYDGIQGLFPWGITDNGDELYWNLYESKISIVVFESRLSGYMVFNMDMESFLYGILRKEIKCSIFPDDFILAENYYEVIP